MKEIYSNHIFAQALQTLSPILLFPCANLTLEVLAVLISLRRLLLGQCRLLQSPRDGPMPTTTRKLSNASYR